MTTDFLIGAIRASRDLHPQVKTELEEILAGPVPRLLTAEEINGEEDYVNVHPYCLHIWRPQHQDLPKPPKIFV